MSTAPTFLGADERDRNLCLHEIIEHWAIRTPEAIAVVFDGRTLTYRELNARANDLAQHLLRAGIQTGTLVGVSMKRSPEMVVALLAIHKAGGAYVPVEPSLPKERLEFVAKDTAMPLVITNGNALHVESTQVIDLAKDPVPDARANTADLGRSRTTPDDLVYVIYTSGSTGQPKGVMVPHRGVVNWLVWMRRVFAATPDDVVLSKAPLSFDVSAWELFLPLISGARLVLADSSRQYDQRYLAELMASNGVTIAQFVPSLMRAFLEQESLPDLSALRHVMCGGEILTPKLAALFHERLDAELCNSYGPTEASIGVTRWICRRNEQRETVPIGYAIDNTELHILDWDLKPVQRGAAGELCITGICLGRGYLNRPELTAERFVPNPFGRDEGERMYRTGDLCRFLEDGSIDFLGRADDQVKVRGVRIELAEVEKALVSSDMVAAAAATVHEPGERAVLAAYVVPAPGSAVTDQELRSFLRRKLPLSMVPSVFYFVSSLPVSANGKLDRKALSPPRTALPAGEAQGDEIETRLRAIWADLLGRTDFGSASDFFDCGGDSFSAMQLYLRMEEEFDLDGVLDSIDPPTIRNMADAIRATASGSDESGRGSLSAAKDSREGRWIGDVLCRLATLDDIDGIWRVCSRAFPAYAASTQREFEALCRHRWSDNPCRADGDPFGWVLEASDGEIVGFHGVVPTRVWIAGESVPAIAPTTWAADPGHGGGGLALLTTYLDWGSQRFLLNTTANSITSAMHEHGNRGMRRIPIADFDQRLLWILNFTALLKWKLGQKDTHTLLRRIACSRAGLNLLAAAAPFAFGVLGGARAAMRTALGRAGIRFDGDKLSIERVKRFGPEFDVLWDRLKWEFDVVTERSAAVLNWRHIDAPKLLGPSHVLACRDEGELVGYVALREPANTVPGHFVITDLFYDPARRDVMHNLANAAFEYAVARSATVLELFGFHPELNDQLRSQSPYVLRRAQLERLGRDPSLTGVFAVLFRFGAHASSSYWYRAPSAALAEACAAGSWWPSGIDGDLNL